LSPAAEPAWAIRSDGPVPILNLDKRAPTDVGQFAESLLAAARCGYQLLGNELPALMVSAVGQFGANLIQHNIHVGFRAVVKLIHNENSLT
jgi:hypothetical protein